MSQPFSHKKTKETKKPTSCHLMQPVAWRCPDLGLSPKIDVCRIMLLLCATLSYLQCGRSDGNPTAHLANNLKACIRATFFDSRRSSGAGRCPVTSKHWVHEMATPVPGPWVPTKKTKDALHPSHSRMAYGCKRVHQTNTNKTKTKKTCIFASQTPPGSLSIASQIPPGRYVESTECICLCASHVAEVYTKIKNTFMPTPPGSI